MNIEDPRIIRAILESIGDRLNGTDHNPARNCGWFRFSVETPNHSVSATDRVFLRLQKHGGAMPFRTELVRLTVDGNRIEINTQGNYTDESSFWLEVPDLDATIRGERGKYQNNSFLPSQWQPRPKDIEKYQSQWRTI